MAQFSPSKAFRSLAANLSDGSTSSSPRLSHFPVDNKSAKKAHWPPWIPFLRSLDVYSGRASVTHACVVKWRGSAWAEIACVCLAIRHRHPHVSKRKFSDVKILRRGTLPQMLVSHTISSTNIISLCVAIDQSRGRHAMRHHGFEVVTRALDGDMKRRLDFKSILTQEASTKVAEEPADPRSRELTSGSTSYTDWAAISIYPFCHGPLTMVLGDDKPVHHETGSHPVKVHLNHQTQRLMVSFRVTHAFVATSTIKLVLGCMSLMHVSDAFPNISEGSRLFVRPHVSSPCGLAPASPTHFCDIWGKIRSWYLLAPLSQKKTRAQSDSNAITEYLGWISRMVMSDSHCLGPFPCCKQQSRKRPSCLGNLSIYS